jgi:cytochrome c oxidase cbb3-type subunit 2
MPSYDHLFEAGDRRGEDLVAYLENLGVQDAHESALRAPSLDAMTPDGDASRGAPAFDLYCARCHGVDGRGGGPLAPVFGSKPAMNLRKGAPWLVSWGAGAPPLHEGLSAVIRHGIAGTEMPGHEALPARTIADIAAYVEQELIPGVRSPSSAETRR